VCCIAAAIVVFGPRLGILLWWLGDSERWNSAFDSFVLPFLGFVFLPWTTLAFVAVAPRGVVAGADWLWLAFGFLLDLTAYGFGRRSRTAYA
jgi:hypothetical protein